MTSPRYHWVELDFLWAGFYSSALSSIDVLFLTLWSWSVVITFTIISSLLSLLHISIKSCAPYESFKLLFFDTGQLSTLDYFYLFYPNKLSKSSFVSWYLNSSIYSFILYGFYPNSYIDILSFKFLLFSTPKRPWPSFLWVIGEWRMESVFLRDCLKKPLPYSAVLLKSLWSDFVIRRGLVVWDFNLLVESQSS